jgi:hypothetical protein
MSASGDRAYWEQAENVPRELVPSVFVDPPDARGGISSTCLVIGARGAGKTFLLDHTAEMHNGCAVKIDLRRHLSSAHEQARRGAASFTFDLRLAAELAGKSAALLGFAIATSIAESGRGMPAQETLTATLPGKLRHLQTLNGEHSLLQIREEIERAPLAMFSADTNGDSPLRAYLEQLGAELQEPLLVLFDRGDLVVAPTLEPVFSLLDQAANYTAVAAMRPGIPSQSMSFLTRSGIVPGDHYPVVYVGQYPRSAAWRAFVTAALNQQPEEFRRHLAALPDDLLSLVLDLTRDSIRWAVDIIWRFGVFSSGQGTKAALDEALIHCRNKMQRFARASLADINKDVGTYVAGLRKDAFGGGVPDRPVLVDLATTEQQELTPTPSDVDVFVALGLRHGVLGMPNGEAWYPGDSPRELEVNPLLLSLSKGPFGRLETEEPARVRHTPSQIRGGGRRPQRPFKVFVGHTMNDVVSQAIPAALAAELSKFQVRRPFEVETGRSGAGLWAETVRKRIEAAHVVVGDVTRMRFDVLAELGYGYGFARHIIPVVESKDQIDLLPPWLRRFNVSWVGSEEGVQLTAAWCANAVTSGSRRKGPPPVPTRVLWLRSLDWNANTEDGYSNFCLQNGLTFESSGIDGDDAGEGRAASPSELFGLVASAGLLVASIDGRQGDQFVHFAAASVAARPQAKGSSPPRRVILLVHPDLDARQRDIVAESISSHPNIEVVSGADTRVARHALRRYVESIQSWRRSYRPPDVLGSDYEDGPES